MAGGVAGGAIVSERIALSTSTGVIVLAWPPAEATALPWRPLITEVDADRRRWLDLARGRFVWPYGDVT